jgi:hypothetical protein
MKDHEQLMLEAIYERLLKEEANPDAKEDNQLKDTFRSILKAYRIEENIGGLVSELFDAVQKHIKETLPES